MIINFVVNLFSYSLTLIDALDTLLVSNAGYWQLSTADQFYH